MMRPDFPARIVPVLPFGLVRVDGIATATLLANGRPCALDNGRARPDPADGDIRLELQDGGARPLARPVTIRRGGWSGKVQDKAGRTITGTARDDLASDRPVTVVAFVDTKIVGVAFAENARFRLRLPLDLLTGPRRTVHLGIAGSDYLLEGGTFAVGRPHRPEPAARAALGGRAIRIKIATPNLKEAPMWGDYHFANSLRASFERLGQRASVDTHDAWYARPEDQDVAIVLRGRNRYVVNPEHVNLMWLISHPDRIEAGEFEDYAHIGVASDIHARRLKEDGVKGVRVLHQATDAALFGGQAALPRIPASLFVGNSRREYRTMVRWCISRNLPLELYGGGWDGVVDPAMLRAPSIANVDLPRFYASHLVLLNDHWDSMRLNGFLSNRLFDGSATGTPILTDGVAGLSQVFGDTIAVADTADAFAARIEDALARPAHWLDRAAEARAIVLGAHTFDHRAREIMEMIESA